MTDYFGLVGLKVFGLVDTTAEAQRCGPVFRPVASSLASQP